MVSFQLKGGNCSVDLPITSTLLIGHYDLFLLVYIDPLLFTVTRDILQVLVSLY